MSKQLPWLRNCCGASVEGSRAQHLEAKKGRRRWTYSWRNRKDRKQIHLAETQWLTVFEDARFCGPTLPKSSSSQQPIFKGLQNRFDAFSCCEFPTVATLFAPDPSKKSSRTVPSARAAPPALSVNVVPATIFSEAAGCGPVSFNSV